MEIFLPDESAVAGHVTAGPGPTLAALVHKRDPSQVLVAGYRLAGAGGLVDVSWDAVEAVYLQAHGECFSITLAAESFRQAAVLMTHQALEVGPDQRFVMRQLTAEVEPHALVVRGQTPLLTVGVELVSDEQGNRGRRIKWDMTLWRDGREVGRSHGDLTAMGEETYQALRSTVVAPRAVCGGADVLATDLGKHRQADVLIDAPHGPGRSLLRVPLDHATYFDHPLDHIPGMLVIEAACQSAVHAAGNPSAVVAAVDARFSRFAEFWPQCDIATAWDSGTPDGDTYVVTITQAGDRHGVIAVHLVRS